MLSSEINVSKVGLTFHKKKQAFCCFDPMTDVDGVGVMGGGVGHW